MQRKLLWLKWELGAPPKQFPPGEKASDGDDTWEVIWPRIPGLERQLYDSHSEAIS